MGEPPDEGGDQHRGPAAPEVALEEGDGEGATRQLLGDGREEADEEHDDPGDVGVHHLPIGDVGRHPGTQLARHQVEDGHVGHEGHGHGQPDDRAQEEPFGADAVGQELLRQADLFPVAAPVRRLRGGDDEGDEHPVPEAPEECGEQLIAHEAAVGVSGVEGVLGHRQHVELRQEGEGEGDAAEGQGRAPAHLVTADADHQPCGHGDHGEEQERAGRQAGGFVAGAQLPVVAGPVLRDLQELGVPAHLVALNLDAVAVGRVPDLEAAQLPGEEVVDAVGPLAGLGLHELQVRCGPGGYLGQEPLGQGPRRGLVEERPRRRLVHLVSETHQLAPGGVLHPVLLLLELPGPAVAPAPQAHRAVDGRGGALEAQLALEEGLGVVVEAEDGAVPVPGQVEAAVLEEGPGLLGRLRPSDGEVDGGLGEGLVEEVGAHQQAGDGHGDAHPDEAQVLPL
ncbi:MAG: hypothetical protein ABIL09_16175 [Gemmatimonadota bacterium]